MIQALESLWFIVSFSNFCLIERETGYVSNEENCIQEKGGEQ
jgi:hypothetical protein